MNIFSILALASLAISACLAYPHEHGHGGEEGKDTFAPAHYTFEYGVHDPHSKDVKSQHEHRDGDTVKGEYTVKEPDGTKRVVEYTADKHHGFQAVVKRIGHAQHPHVYGDHKGHGEGGTSYVEVTHWGHGSGK